MRTILVADVTAFRSAARRLLAAEVTPDEVALLDDASGMTLALGEPEHPREQRPQEEHAWARENAPPDSTSRREKSERAAAGQTSVPRIFVAIAHRVACHRDARRWDLLYRLLYRLTHGEPSLLEVATDPDVSRLSLLDHAVRRARHKMTAFVRFEKVSSGANREHGENEEEFVAWYVPEHRVLPITVDFFVERFGRMRWAILTPEASAYWDREKLQLGPGVGAREARARLGGDALVALWRSYYANIFNPARVKVAAMQREMPKRHWATLPETDLVARLLADAPARVASMIAVQQATMTTSAASWIPRASQDGRPTTPTTARSARSLEVLREAARACRGCELCESATQTVFGEGPIDAPLMLVGEQPGDAEDIAGRVFVGPAGKVLRTALEAAGVPVERVYMTNTVKHFRHRVDGPRRLHATPKVGDVRACKPWLDEELALIAPRVVVALGMTAGRALLGPLVRAERRGVWLPTAAGASLGAMLTWHPSAALRAETGGDAIVRELALHLRAAWDRAQGTSDEDEGDVDDGPCGGGRP